MFDRTQMIEEIRIRDTISKAVRLRAKKFREERHKEERELRLIIRELLKEATAEKKQHRSTGINVLEDLLKKIIPVLEQDYKMLTTDSEQRKSFAAHLITAVENSLAPVAVTSQAGSGGKFIGIDELDAVQEIDVVVGSDSENPEDDDAFIDIEDESEEEGNFQDISDEDKTGANFAQATFDKIETQTIDAFSLLSNEEDQKLFEDYLITNLKLYFDKFEDELSATLSEPTTPEYEAEKETGSDAGETGGEDLEV